MMQLHGRGIHRILLAARMAAVAKLIYEAPEEMGYSIASLFNKSAYNPRGTWIPTSPTDRSRCASFNA
jgi:hypothetical protein